MRRLRVERTTGIRPAGGVRRPAAGARPRASTDGQDASDELRAVGPSASDAEFTVGDAVIHRAEPACPEVIRLRGGFAAPGITSRPTGIRPASD